MDTFHSELFGDVPMPASVESLLQLVRESLNGKRYEVYLWRGQADIEWPVHSSAYRRLKLDMEVVTDEEMEHYERGLLDHATHRGYRYHRGRQLSDFELLARLQHHGAATRLVDFTKSVLVGLYFACEAHFDKTGVLIGLHSDYFDGYEATPEDRPYLDVINTMTDGEYVRAWEPSRVSPRIAAQHSQFLYSIVSNDKKGSLRVPAGSLLAIAISPVLKQTALQELSAFYDIRHLTLFPDIDGFGYAHSHRFHEFDNDRY